MTTTFNNPITDSLVEKIRKLLALASDLNDSKEQAEAAMKKAVALATLHSVDIAAIEVFEAKKSDEPIEKDESISLGKRASVCQTYIGHILRNHFNVRVIYTGSRYYGRGLVLIGKRSDIEIANYIHSFLNTEFMRLWHGYRKTNPMAQTKDRNSYLWGLYDGMCSKLKEGESEAKKSAFDTLAQTRTNMEVNQVRNCVALTVTTHQERLEEATGKFFPHLRSKRSYVSYSHSGEARQAGYSAGRTISLRRGVENGGSGMIE